MLQGTRIAVEIFMRRKLQRVDVDADDDMLCSFAGELNQRDMPVMQVTHGRHEGDALIIGTPCLDP